jgi:hypothetical protein
MFHVGIRRIVYYKENGGSAPPFKLEHIIMTMTLYDGDGDNDYWDMTVLNTISLRRAR